MRRLLLLASFTLVLAACGRSDGANVTTSLPGLPVTTTTTAPATTTTAPVATTSTATGSTTTATALPPLQGVALEPVADGFEQPVWAGLDPALGEVIVIERRGRILTIDGEVVFDIDARVGSGSSEQGLLGIAFHPSDPDLFYVNYTDTGGDTVVAEFSRTGGVMDPATETKLLQIPQPASNHNGGNLAFGPDGMLYVGLGDGGAANDRFNNGQDPFTLLGSMLRLDPTSPSGDLPYSIPADNPFVEGGGDPLVWATGLRNPWRFAFDGDLLYIADVGQNEWEEVNVVPVDGGPALDFGWPTMEGTTCFRTRDCGSSGLVRPVVEYSHGEGCSVTGGVVMRDPAIPELDGFYVYGDFCSGFVRGFLGPEAGGQAELLAGVGNISHFGVDRDGAVLVVTLSGEVSRIVPLR